ncbi:MAG: 50S ribosomal protein L22 [Bacteroidia bacterium]
MQEKVKLTRKEKIAAGVPKEPKRKTAYADRLKEDKASICTVSLRNYRSSARKMRLVVDQIRGMEVSSAMHTLKFTPKAAAPAVLRLLQSAVSSYEEKFDDKVDDGTHYVSAATVDGARMLKRLNPAPQGRAHLIRKRYCHVTLTIDAIPEIEEEPSNE